MAKRIKYRIEEIKKIIEEDRIYIDHGSRELIEEFSRYKWEEIPIDKTILEAHPGEDGVFRVDLCQEERDDSDPWGELEKLRKKLEEQEKELERFIFGNWK